MLRFFRIIHNQHFNLKIGLDRRIFILFQANTVKITLINTEAYLDQILKSLKIVSNH